MNNKLLDAPIQSAVTIDDGAGAFDLLKWQSDCA